MPRRITEFRDLQLLVRDQPPRIALILGSGLSELADQLEDARELPFGGVPGMTASGVVGHRGVLLLGQWTGVPVLVFAGRLHYYEGHAWRNVVQPVHIAKELGASILIATNAAGGIRDDLQPGDLMALRGHLDCTRENWWRNFLPSPLRGRGAGGEGGVPQRELGEFYSPRLQELLALPRGIYAQLTGPSYETPAEIRVLRTLGVDAVGMSTGREIETGHALGMECAAISCITNKAAGLSNGAIHHGDVLETGRNVRTRMIGVLEALIHSL
jgi:purine-nucleoside phosphorylase